MRSKRPGFYSRPRVVAVGNVLLSWGVLGTAPLLFPKLPDADFLRLWYGFLVLFSLFWVWMFVANPEEWTELREGRLHWKVGTFLPRSGSADVADVKSILVETTAFSGTDGGSARDVSRHFLMLKDGRKFEVPRSVTEHPVYDELREMNSSIVKIPTVIRRDPAARA